MRFYALSAAIVGLALFTSDASANKDLDALMSELSFGGQSSHAPAVLEDASDATIDLLPVPTNFAMPEFATVPPKISLQNPIATRPQSATSQSVDFNAAFAVQEMETARSQTAANAVGFGHLHSASIGPAHAGAPSHCGCGSGNCESGMCDSVYDCTPHVAPCLPTSTLLQYYRTSKCNTHVWDGYTQKCCGSTKHVNGTCDCFNRQHRGCGEILAPCCGPSCGGCKSCDSACDQ